MGQEIAETHFEPEAFERFRGRLAHETRLLERWVEQGRFAEDSFVGGFELEAWLVDHNYCPTPINEAYLARLASRLVVPELSKFNVELNGTPQVFRSGALLRLEQELAGTLRRCDEVAHDLGAALVMIGILPTLREVDLCLANMSPLNRFHALNEQIMRLRRGRAITVDISGRERLSTSQQDVMLEAATTSFQVHLQVPASRTARYYNASLILSAPIVAACANSPILFGQDLWDETRVPLFEQAVAHGGDQKSQGAERVTFGSGYVQDSITECFAENAARHPCLLPIELPDGDTKLAHLRLHNGTVWRWNRPLIGFDASGTPHFRIEHRVLPSGPTVVDQVANAALYFGLAHHLAERRAAPERVLPFAAARKNFYRAARYGLEAQIVWMDGSAVDARALLLGELLPAARAGLTSLGVGEDEIDRYLGIVEARVARRQTGAAWLRNHLTTHGRDLVELTATYLERSRSGIPVHEWDA